MNLFNPKMISRRLGDIPTIPDVHKAHLEAWAEVALLTAEIKANEDRINAIVHELFELTDDEIILMEANI